MSGIRVTTKEISSWIEMNKGMSIKDISLLTGRKYDTI